MKIPTILAGIYMEKKRKGLAGKSIIFKNNILNKTSEDKIKAIE